MASSVTNDQEPPSKKKKTKPISNPSLPDDLVVSCLARFSRLYYPTLSLVSKSFRSLVTSLELHKARSLLNRSERCLYVCLQYSSETYPRWFTLCRKPDKTLNDSHVLAPLSFLNSPPLQWSCLIAVGHNLYAIPGQWEVAPRSNISFLDCRSHTWLEAPSMRLAYSDISMRRLYLPESYEDPESLNCIEVFNTKTQTWKPVPPEKQMINVSNMEGKICTICCGIGYAFKPKEKTSEHIGLDSVCIKGISYGYDYSKDSKEFHLAFMASNNWRKVEGLEGLPKFAGNRPVKLADYGGKLVVFWDEYVSSNGYKEKMIWCAEISLERHSDEEIWGHVEWCDAVLTVPKSYKFVYAVAATV